jgi:putative aldouronate transport system substrate-binding protein
MTIKSKLNRRQFLQGLGVGSTALLVAACAQPTPAAKAPEPTKAPAAPPPATTQPPPATKAPEPTKAPAAKEAITFTYWVVLAGNVAATMKSYDEIRCFQEAEKKTGIHISFQHPAAGQGTEQFNLLLTSRNYPDFMEYSWLSVPGGPAKAIKDGVIVRLNELVDKHAPNLKKILTEHPEWRRQCVTDEGDLYVFPFLRGHPILWTSAGPIVRQDWLDKVGLPLPTTMDEWTTMLRAFKTKDPNGNGKADEVPLSFSGKFWFDRTHGFVGAWGVTTGFYQDNGIVKYGPMQPEFKGFLAQMAAWYKEGLLDADYASLDGKGLDTKITGNLVGANIHAGGSGLGRYIQLMTPNDPKVKWAPTLYPALKKGETVPLGLKDPVYPGTGLAITTACKSAPAAVQWADFWYGPEGHLLGNFGVEGESYTMVNGYPTFTKAVTSDPKMPMNQMMAKYCLSGFTGGALLQDWRYLEQYFALPEQKEALKLWTNAKNERQLPPVTPSQDESKKFASIMNDVTTRYNEMVDKFIVGAEPLDKFDDFVRTLKQMGIDDAVKIQQAALDRYNKRP